MSIYDTIKNFNKQFNYQPEIKNRDKLKKFGKFIVVGMGGSGLSAGLLKAWKLDLDLLVHKDYGLPSIPNNDLKDSLIICSSYSGNTEETLDSFNQAIDKDLSVAVVAAGGALLKFAQDRFIPYVQIPDTGIRPRLALGYSLRGLMKLMNKEEELEELSELSIILNPSDYETEGEALAQRLNGYAPIIYSSGRNQSIAYNWKIKFNETAKIPAFCNVFPELNHNEMTGFDRKNSTKNLSENFYLIFLKDKDDHPRILRRMEVTEKLYKDRGLAVEIVELQGKNVWHKIFSSLLLADWTAYYIAKRYDVEPEQVPMVEEFKGLIRSAGA